MKGCLTCTRSWPTSSNYPIGNRAVSTRHRVSRSIPAFLWAARIWAECAWLFDFSRWLAEEWQFSVECRTPRWAWETVVWWDRRLPTCTRNRASLAICTNIQDSNRFSLRSRQWFAPSFDVSLKDCPSFPIDTRSIRRLRERLRISFFLLEKNKKRTHFKNCEVSLEIA